NQIVATVPGGATSGPISVTVGTVTATSSASFSVTGPMITGFAPVAGTNGTIVTVTGTGLDPVPGSTTATLDGMSVSITSISNTQFTFAVPSTATSGPIQITTPNGQATSANDFIIAPGSIGAANIITSSTLTTSGPVQNLDIGVANSYGVFAFGASTGQWLTVQLAILSTTISGGNVAYQVYSPSNAQIASGTVSASVMSIHLPQIQATGTYIVAFGSGSGTVDVSAALETDASLTINAAPQSISALWPWQSKRLVWTATAGQSLVLGITNYNPGLGSDFAQLTAYAPDGSLLATSSCGYLGCLMNLNSVPTTGTYTVVIQPLNANPLNFTAALVTAVTGSLTTTGSPVTVVTTVPGQSATLTFSGTQGENLGFGITNLVLVPASVIGVTVDIYSPSGMLLNSSCNTTSPGCGISLNNLPLTGTYSIVITPAGTAIMNLTATLTQDVTGTLSPDTPLAINLTTPGENALLTFSGTPGQVMSLQVSGVSTTPAGAPLQETVYNPDGTTFSTTTTNTIIVPIASSANYSVLIAPYYGATATMQVATIPMLLGALGINAPGSNFSTTSAGQSAYLTFSATAGQNLGLGITNLALNPSSVT
ncbi:MAG: hypothetical protein B7X10_01705, partial [Burkholderiales bacterium 21-58-4]